MAVSLSDILEVRGEPLREREVWALLCQSAAAIQDFFIKGASGKKDGTSFVINPMTLTVCRDGQVSLTPGDSTWHGSDFKAPECCSEAAHILSDTATEKIFLYTLGKTLQVATEYGLCKNEYVGVSHHLDSLLETMCEKNPAVRIGLRSILEACDLHTRQHPEKTPYAQTICDLYSSVLGSVDQIGMDSSHNSDNSQQRTVTSRSRRRPRLPYHLHRDQHSSPSCSPPPTRSRSRSPAHSRSQGTEDSGDGNRSFVKPSKNQTVKTDSSPPIKLYDSTSLPSSTAPTGILTTITTTSSCTIPSRRPASPHDLNMSFASSAGDHTSLYHSAPAYQAFPSMPGLLSLNMGNPAYEKYLQLKERRHRLKTAKIGEQAQSEVVGFEGLSAAHPIPLLCGTWRGDIMDYMTDAHSMASLMSYTPGSCMPELSLLDTHPAVPVVHGDLDGGSLLSSDLSVLMPVAAQTHLNQQNHSLPEELKQPYAHPETSACVKRRWEDDTPEEQQKRQSDRYHQPAQEVTRESSHQLQKSPQPLQHPYEEHLSNQHSSPQQPLLKEQSVPSQRKEVQKQQLQQMHQFGSRDLTPTPDALPAKEYYGPEFVHRASHPVIRMSLPLQGESIKNPALARRIIIVHVTGQKFEAIVDPCMTSRQLFDAVVTHTALDDFFFFGLTYIYEGEHFFLDADTKLHKMAPEGWREGAKGHMPPVTFTLYLRVKFYPDSLSDFRHLSSHHLLYLQLRRDVLEERCMTDDQQLLALSGLALHAEFGDYSRRTMGHNYFVPEQYLPPRVARRLGMGYVHDQALEAHRDALGLAPSQCEIQFIKMVQKLPEYGIHFYRLMKGKNDTDNLVWVGITQTSLLIAEQSGSQRTVMQALSWPAIMKISFNKRRFSVQPKVDPAAHKGKPPKISFFTNSYRKGRYLLQLSTAQHRFHIRMRTRAAAMENTHTAALESLGGEGLGELEEWQSKQFSPVRQQASVENKKEGEGTEEEDQEKEEEGRQILRQQSVTPVETCIGSTERAPVDSPGKQLVSPENDSVGPEERDEVPPVKYRSPPSYHPNLDCLMEELSADKSVHAQDMTAASSDKIASVNFGIVHGREQMTTLQDDAASPLADRISSPQLSEQLAADFSPHDHPPSHHHRPASHLASGQPSLGRQITEVTLQKEGDKGIGITIVGGETTSSLDLGIFVKSVMKDGPAARTGQIQAGDRLIAINGVSLEGVQHHEAVQLIRQSVGSVRLLVSQMQPPVTIKQKLSGTKTRFDNESDAVYLSDDDFETSSHVPSDHSNNIPSACNTAASQSHHSPVHHSHHSLNSSDLMDDGKMELVKNSVSECLVLSELGNNSVSADARDEMLLSEEMLAATELDSQDYGPGNIGQTLKAETEFDKEIQELHILEEIVNMTVDNSDTDSDFESAVQATVEGKVTKSFSCKTSEGSSPLRKGISISSPDTVVYEVVLEKEQGALGIIISEGEENNRLCVQSLVPGGPAESGGILQPGDCLLELNGQSVCGITSTDLQKALQSAPDICLLKVGRTKSLDDLAQEQPPEQFNKGHGSSDHKQCASAVSGETSWDDLAGPESQISPPSAFASVAPTPINDIPSIPVVLPPPQLTFDLPRVEDVHSNNTQSDIDSDVLDSSRSELEHIYRSAENYLEDDRGDFELDDVVNMESMSMGVDKSENGVETQRNAHSSGEVHSDSSCQGGHCGANGNLSSIETLHTSPLTVCSVDSVLHLAWKSQSKCLVQQEHVTEAFKKRNAAAADEQTSDNDQVQEFTVELIKSAGGGLGFTVVGGVSTTGGCYVKAVVQDPALSDGRLRAGDRLIQVNGQDMMGLSHFEAVTFLRQTPKEVYIRIQRCNHTTEPFMNSPHQTRENGPPNKIQHFTGGSEQAECHTEKSHNAVPDENSSESVLDQQQASTENKEGQLPVKNPTKCGNTPKAVIRPYTYGQQDSSTQDRAKTHTTELGQARAETNTGVVRIVLDKLQLSDSLGFSLIQRCMDCGQTGIFIKTLTPGGIAQTDGHLRVGDRLLQVNGESLIGCSHTKAVRLLREASGSVVLTIFRYSEEQSDSSETKDLSRDTSHLINEGPSTSACSSDCLSDDDINDILDEAINFLDNEVRDNPKTLKTGSRKQDLPIPSEARELNILGQVEQNMPMSIKQTEFHPESNSKTSDCSASKFSLPPMYGEVSGLSNKAQGSHDEASQIKILEQRGYVRKVSSVEIPEDLTTRTLLSLPILRMRNGTEERTMQLLQLLADAVEQEEPLLEFEKLRLMKATDNMEVAKLPENKTRNRYRNVLPYDYNRVKLHTNSPEGNDYINASDVQLSVKDKEEPLCYIACQGPLMVTQGHFWQMVWETGASVVVMLTQEIESGKVKCHRYWPQVPDEPLDLCNGKYSVQLVKEQKLEDFDIRHFRLHNLDSGEERKVVHLHYITWPDHGVPDSACPLLQFVRLMHQLHQNGPFVVHCSAGIGRSGVLMAVDTALARIETGDELDLFDIVSELRHQRYGMIQTQDQYLFCYTACMEALLSKEQ